jgi:hypothetical protein
MLSERHRGLASCSAQQQPSAGDFAFKMGYQSGQPSTGPERLTKHPSRVPVTDGRPHRDRMGSHEGSGSCPIRCERSLLGLRNGRLPRLRLAAAVPRSPGSQLTGAMVVYPERGSQQRQAGLSRLCRRINGGAIIAAHGRPARTVVTFGVDIPFVVPGLAPVRAIAQLEAVGALETCGIAQL